MNTRAACRLMGPPSLHTLRRSLEILKRAEHGCHERKAVQTCLKAESGLPQCLDFVIGKYKLFIIFRDDTSFLLYALLIFVQ